MDGQSYVVKWRKLDSDTIDNVPFPRQFLEALGNSIRKLRPQRAIIYGSAVKQGLNARDIDLLISYPSIFVKFYGKIELIF